MKKRYRVYFNRRSEAPQIWSVDEGDQSTEMIVQWLSFDNIYHIYSKFDPEVRPAEADRKPKAWFEFEAFAEFRGGGVTFHERQWQ